MSDEFWAAIAGAIVGSITGGAISFLLQKTALKEARAQQKETALTENQRAARSLIFKVSKIKSHLVNLRQSIEEGISDAKSKKWNYWQAVRPLANLPDKIQITSDEMSILLLLKEDDLFNAVMPLDDIYNSTLGIFETLKESRNQLASMLPAEQMIGIQGTTVITKELLSKAGPKMAEVDDLVSGLQKRLEMDDKQTSEALKKLVPILNQKLKLGIKVQDKPQTTNS